MNAEALIGTVLGTCTLQKLIGQGGMGAVFLAQQSRPRRQVAVKVLLPMTPLSPHQLAAFLERFRRETDAAASLEHPNIVPVHEYGERDGLAYLVMPYISGGTLRDELERDGQLPLSKVANYLEQLAMALDFAHEHGVIHRDIKPANIMITPEGRLLLGDFGLVKIVAEGQAPQVRLTGAGAPVGTPDYMAPEQVIGEEIDARADLYSLGVILYQMVTGTTPFHGETPMQIAAQHLQIPPPSAQMLRPDLPIAVEQVIQRALAKRPNDRYMHAQDLANAFVSAMISSGIQLDSLYSGTSTSARLKIPRSQIDAMRQSFTQQESDPGTLAQSAQSPQIPDTYIAPTAPVNSGGLSPTGGLLSRTGKFPLVGTGVMAAIPSTTVAGEGGLLSRTGKFPRVGTDTSTLTATKTKADVAPANGTGGGLLSRTGKFPQIGLDLTARQAVQLPNELSEKRNTGALISPNREALPEAQETGTTFKLNNSMKVVKMPVAGQPGQFVTGLLPTASRTSDSGEATSASTRKAFAVKPWQKIAFLALALLVVLASIVGIVWFVRSHSTNQATTPANTAVNKPNSGTTNGAGANVILSDPLDHNIHNWRTDPPNAFSFKNGAYHITATDDATGNASILGKSSFEGPLSYTLTMQEITGDDNKEFNSFGMIFRFTEQNDKKNKNGDPIATFYSFEVQNYPNGQYQLWKYDNITDAATAWVPVKDGMLPIGDEFHKGHGPQAVNTIKISMKGDQFTVTVNGKTLPKTFQDGSLTKGSIGMLVNLKGTEVAFKNLVLTKN